MAPRAAKVDESSCGPEHMGRRTPWSTTRTRIVAHRPDFQRVVPTAPKNTTSPATRRPPNAAASPHKPANRAATARSGGATAKLPPTRLRPARKGGATSIRTFCVAQPVLSTTKAHAPHLEPRM